MVCFPNAKINIGLYVTEKRADEYHNIETVFLPVSVFDALEILPNDYESTHLYTYGENIQGDLSENLILKAYYLLKEDFPVRIQSLDVILQKSIAMGAGLGGGSADAACMLSMLNDYFGLELSKNQLIAYALRLGSDCPFFIYNKPCYAQGRGELLKELSIDLHKYSLQIVCPKIHVSTADAFKQIVPGKPNVNLQEIVQCVSIGEWKNYLKNAFESIVFKAHPEILAIKNQFYEQGALYASMTGTGAAVYAFFPKEKFAQITSSVFFKSYELKDII